MKDLKCPYCEFEQDASPDDKEPGVTFEHQCENCDKYFGYEIDYDPIYTVFDLPCANGEPHKWKQVGGISKKVLYKSILL